MGTWSDYTSEGSEKTGMGGISVMKVDNCTFCEATPVDAKAISTGPSVGLKVNHTLAEKPNTLASTNKEYS